MVTPLQLYCISKRLKLPIPTCGRFTFPCYLTLKIYTRNFYLPSNDFTLSNIADWCVQVVYLGGGKGTTVLS